VSYCHTDLERTLLQPSSISDMNNWETHTGSSISCSQLHIPLAESFFADIKLDGKRPMLPLLHNFTSH